MSNAVQECQKGIDELRNAIADNKKVESLHQEVELYRRMLKFGLQGSNKIREVHSTYNHIFSKENRVRGLYVQLHNHPTTTQTFPTNDFSTGMHPMFNPPSMFERNRTIPTSTHVGTVHTPTPTSIATVYTPTPTPSSTTVQRPFVAPQPTFNATAVPVPTTGQVVQTVQRQFVPAHNTFPNTTQETICPPLHRHDTPHPVRSLISPSPTIPNPYKKNGRFIGAQSPTLSQQRNCVPPPRNPYLKKPTNPYIKKNMNRHILPRPTAPRRLPVQRPSDSS